MPENRRSLMSTITGKSLDDLRSVDISDVGLTGLQTVRQQASYGREAGDLKKYSKSHLCSVLVFLVILVF